MEGDCSGLEELQNFESYIRILRNRTDDLTVSSMQPCWHEICKALYGTGSSDVSGIGVIVGYFIEFSLAIIFTAMLLVLKLRKQDRWMNSLRKITAAYVDSAIALALSVELACTIMLVKKNFGLGAYEFGGLTVQIVWIVAIVVMLPVTSFCWQDFGDRKFEQRLCMTSMAFLLFLIAFSCRMISTYSHRQIGTNTDSIIDDEEAGQIEFLCFGQNLSFSSSGSMIVEVFSIGGSLWISSNIVVALIDQCIDRKARSRAAKAFQTCTDFFKDDIRGSFVSATVLAIWSAPLLWALLTLRSWQKAFAARLDEQSGSDVWSFGQIIAVIVFLPVLNELLHQYLEGSKSSRAADQEQVGTVAVVAQSPKPSSA